MSTNAKCLEGIQCPACGNEEMFRIEVLTMATVTDDGTDFDQHGGVDWDENSYAECANCCAHGKLSRFMARNARPAPESQPSPGPWEHGEWFDGFPVLDASGRHVATCDAWSDRDESEPVELPAEANARLIAAAPDLLAALEQALTALNAPVRFPVPSLLSDSDTIAAICERAIARARGAAR